MRVEIIKGNPLENGAKPLYCGECSENQVYADAVIYFGKMKIKCCAKHLCQLTELLHQARFSPFYGSIL